MHDPSRVVRCLRAMLAPSAGDNTSSVIASVYEQLLARRGALLDGGVAGADIVLGSSGDGAARAALRLGLLKSLVAHCRIVLEEELSSSLTGQVSSHTAGVHVQQMNTICATAAHRGAGQLWNRESECVPSGSCVKTCTVC